MDTDYKGKDVHVLGFHFDPAVPIFQQALAWNRSGRVERVMKIIEKIQSLGYELSFQEVKRELQQAPIALGVPILPAFSSKRGNIFPPTVKDVLIRSSRQEKPAYLRQVKMSPFEAARIIHKAGGIAVLAHPAEIENLSYVEEILHSGVMDGWKSSTRPFCRKKTNMIGLPSRKSIISWSAAESDLTWQSGRFPHALRGIFDSV